jgi:hypothetical protein
MNNAFVSALLSLLFATPLQSWPQEFSTIWSKAQAVAAASSTPTPIADVSLAPVASPSPIALASATASPIVAVPSADPSEASTPVTVATYAPPPQVAIAYPPSTPIAVWTYPPATAAPQTPPPDSPSSSPIAQATIMPPGTTYSSAFTGNTPFHHQTQTSRLYGATVLPQQIANNLWAQGFLSVSGAQLDHGMPFWPAGPGDPTYTFQCPAFGTCGANGMSFSLPAGASAQCSGGGGCQYDYHFAAPNSALAYELDGWGGGPNDGRCALSSGVAHCMSGAKYPYAGSGLSVDLPKPSDADAGGYAIGLGEVSYRDRIAGPLNHSFTLVVSCLDASRPAVWPSTHTPDSTCSGGGNEPLPSVVYGDWVALKPDVDPSTLTSNPDCLWLLTGLRKFGAAIQDSNNGYGLEPNIEPSYDLPTSQRAAWQSVQANIAGGSCLARVPAADVYVLEWKPGTANLPLVSQI